MIDYINPHNNPSPFPTTSPYCYKNSIVSLKHLFKYEKLEQNCALLTFPFFGSKRLNIQYNIINPRHKLLLYLLFVTLACGIDNGKKKKKKILHLCNDGF